MAFGLAWTFLGLPRTRVLAPALGFLVFMMPFPNALVVHLSYALKEITVRISTALAGSLGVVLMRDGMTLLLEGGELHVENPCSGLRSLMALLATGAVFGLLQPGSWWRRAVIFLAAVPVAMLGNALRIALLIVVAHYVGVRQATGVFHDASGYLIYAVALVSMMALRRLLMPRAAVKA